MGGSGFVSGARAVALTACLTSLFAPAHSLAALGDCAQSVSNGSRPTASDCLFLLRTAVALETCTPACICAPKGSLPTAATDALLCLKFVVGQPVTLNCPCETTPTTTSTSSTSSSTSTTTSTTSTTTTLPPPSTSTTAPSTTIATLPSTTTTSTTVTLPGVSCDIDTADCSTTGCSCSTLPGLDYHVGATGSASGPIGTEVRVNINAPQGGTIDCGGWTRIFGNTVFGCDVIGCCQRQSGDPEAVQWSVFEVIDFPCFCPAFPDAGQLQHNFLVQCQLRPGPVTEVEQTSTGCP